MTTRCEFTETRDNWPYVKRCKNDGRHYAFVPIPEMGSTKLTETLIVCDEHATQAEESGILVMRDILEL